LRIGILDIQGNVPEHISMTKKAADKLGLKASVERVKYPEDFENLDALIMPGGESTTILKLIDKLGVREILCSFSYSKPVLGTCAGLVILSKSGGGLVGQSKQKLLGVLDAKVERNAFGRQVESFSDDVTVRGIGRIKGVFIRAPAISSVGESVKVLAEYDGKIVAAEQDNILVTSFHPELTEDTRIHEYFLRKTK